MTTTRNRQSLAAFSLVELVVTVGMLGIITAISLTYYGGTLDSSKSVVANEMKETLNIGLKKHSQVNFLIDNTVVAVDEAAATDEQDVLDLLQTRDDTAPGSPFVRPNWGPDKGDTISTHRLRWNGKTFVVLEPGEAGFGLIVAFDASDYD